VSPTPNDFNTEADLYLSRRSGRLARCFPLECFEWAMLRAIRLEGSLAVDLDFFEEVDFDFGLKCSLLLER
jgi:hypothetical protein